MMRQQRWLWSFGIACAGAFWLAMPGPIQAQAATLPVCADCHEETVKAFVLSKHGAKLDATGAVCQTCHGEVAAPGGSSMPT